MYNFTRQILLSNFALFLVLYYVFFLIFYFILFLISSFISYRILHFLSPFHLFLFYYVFRVRVCLSGDQHCLSGGHWSYVLEGTYVTIFILHIICRYYLFFYLFLLWYYNVLVWNIVISFVEFLSIMYCLHRM